MEQCRILEGNKTSAGDKNKMIKCSACGQPNEVDESVLQFARSVYCNYCRKEIKVIKNG